MPRVLRSLSTCFVPVLAVLAFGCADTGVGDPCIPEQIPAGGFDPGVNYIESQSVSCRTRVCLVYGLDGDPSLSQEECLAAGGNATECSVYPVQVEIDDRVFCSCRCDAPAGSGAPTCDCPGGYSCQEVLTIGSDGERGSYCVPKDIIVE